MSPARGEKSVPSLGVKRFGFQVVCADVSNVSGYKRRLISFEVSVTILLPCRLADSFGKSGGKMS